MKFTQTIFKIFLVLALAIPNVVGIVVAKDLSSSSYIEVDGLKMRFISRYYGDNDTGIAGDGTGSSCEIVSDFKVLFDGNTATGIFLRDSKNGWPGHITPGDYIGVEFETPIKLRGVTFAMDVSNVPKDTYRKAQIEYLLDGSDEWQLAKDLGAGKVSIANFTVEGDPISNVKAVRVKNTHDQDEEQIWVHVKEITVDGSLPGKANYTQVHAAIAKANAIVKADYDPAGVAALEAAVNAVVEDLDESQQDIIDGYAKAINDAYDSLIKIKHELSGKAVDIVEVGNQESDNNDALKNIFDGSASTMWHTEYQGCDRSLHYFIIKVPVNYYDKIQLLPRTGSSVNGIITKLNVYTKFKEEDEFVKVANEVTIGTRDWQTVEFEPTKATYIKVEVLEARSDNNKLFASLAEMKIFYQGGQLNREKWKGVAYFSDGKISEYQDTATAYVKAGTHQSEGSIEYMFDGNLSTIYHSDYARASQDVYRNPTTMILKLGKSETFNYVEWLNRTDVETCRLDSFDLYTIEDGLDYTDEQLKNGAPWVKKFSATAENLKDIKFRVGEQTTKYVKIICTSKDGESHLTCAEFNLYYNESEEASEVRYAGMNAGLDSTLWIKESAYDQKEVVKGYYGTINDEDKFSNEEANLVKYVTSSVLSVKAQTEQVSEDKVNARFITSIASENLEYIRFKAEIINPDGTIKTQYLSTNKAYTNIVADNVRISDAAGVFGNQVSMHFALCKIKNIPLSAAQNGTKIRITPYWAPYGVAEDDYDNYVEGIEREFTVQSLFDNVGNTNVINE